MSESFLFQAIQVGGRSSSPSRVTLAELTKAANVAGWELNPVVRAVDADTVELRHEGVFAGLGLAHEHGGGWTLSVLDDDLEWADGTPDRPAQQSVLTLLRRLLQVAPPYVGVSCWPFGPSLPQAYDTSFPFALAQVGSVMFLSDFYLHMHLPDRDLSLAPVHRQERLGDGVLLIAAENILQSDDDDELNALREFFGLSAGSRSGG